MRFLFVANTERNPNAGASGCDIATMEALRILGHDVDEVWGPDMPRRISHSNLHQLLELPRRFAAAVERRVGQKCYDIIQVNQPHAYRAAEEHQRLKRPGVFINRSHGWEPRVFDALAGCSEDTRSWARRIATKVLRAALVRHNAEVVKWSDGVVLCSIDDRDYIQQYSTLAPDKMLVLPPGISESYLSGLPPEWGDRKNDLLYVGTFHPQKAPKVVAEVFRQTLRSCPTATATWVCETENHAAVLSLLGGEFAHKVSIRGWMPREELKLLFDSHRIFLFPSLFEGFSLTFLEAMSRGCCVVTSRIDGMRQTIRHQENGFTFQPGDVVGLSGVIRQLLIGEIHAQPVAVAGRRTALDFTWKQTAARFADFCAERLAVKCRANA